MTDVLVKNTEGVHETSRGPYIGTHSGTKFYPLDIRASDIHIEDIAHALSHQCRFAGHTEKFYSVAEHCIRVSQVWNTGLAGLLHDASEAYLVDVPSPIKMLLDFGAYRKIEKETQEVIYKKYKLNLIDHNLIKTVDNLLLATEARDLMHDPSWAKGMEKLTEKIVPMDSVTAKREYLRRFKKLYE